MTEQLYAYCNDCGEIREVRQSELLPVTTPKDTGNWLAGDLCCNHCHFIVATMYQPATYPSRSAAKKEAAQRGEPNPYQRIADLTAENARLRADLARERKAYAHDELLRARTERDAAVGLLTKFDGKWAKLVEWPPDLAAEATRQQKRDKENKTMRKALASIRKMTANRNYLSDDVIEAVRDIATLKVRA